MQGMIKQFHLSTIAVTRQTRWTEDSDALQSNTPSAAKRGIGKLVSMPHSAAAVKKADPSRLIPFENDSLALFKEF
jgi:hypothetical protein